MIGSFTHPVVIEQLVETLQDDGDTIRSWDEVTPPDGVYASIKPLLGREYFAADQMKSQVTHRINMWAFPGLTPSQHRIVFGERIFEIVSVVDVQEQGRTMQIMCKEAV